MSKKKPDNHYVDNVKFCEEISKYRAEYLEFIDAENKTRLTRPRISEYLGQTFLDISTNLAYARNFIGYTYRDEMISDAYENCIRYCHNFNPETSPNPFGYFTLICYRAFVRRIKKEKSQHEIKEKLLSSKDAFENATISQPQDPRYYNSIPFDKVQREFQKNKTSRNRNYDYSDDDCGEN